MMRVQLSKIEIKLMLQNIGQISITCWHSELNLRSIQLILISVIAFGIKGEKDETWFFRRWQYVFSYHFGAT